jgi:hypothetical protein
MVLVLLAEPDVPVVCAAAVVIVPTVSAMAAPTTREVVKRSVIKRLVSNGVKPGRQTPTLWGGAPTCDLRRTPLVYGRVRAATSEMRALPKT